MIVFSSVEKSLKKSLSYLLRNNRTGDRGRKYLLKNLNYPFVLNTKQYWEIKNKIFKNIKH